MRRIEITFRVVDDNRNGLELKTCYALDKLDNTNLHEPVLSFAASSDAKKFWESLVLMGYLEK